MKKRYLVAIFCLLLGSASFVIAKPPMIPPGNLENIWKYEDRLLSKIDPTEEQLTKINQIREKFRKEIELLKSQKYDIFAELKLLWMDPDVDEEKIKIKAKTFHDLIWKLIERDIGYRIELRTVLTKEQYLMIFDEGGFR